MLTQRKESALLRSLRELKPKRQAKVVAHEREFINFSSNDYLGLSQDERLREATIQAAQDFGVGATASRLICGTNELHQAVEKKLARLCGREACLLLTSGFQANTSLLSCLTDRNALILMDRDNHHGLVQGARLSAGRVLRYRHNDLNHLEDLLQKNRTGRFTHRWIVTESLFSINGDVVDLVALQEIAKLCEAHLFIDDAHSFGLFGPNGMGLTTAHRNIDLAVGSFGKAGGSFGAYVTCSSFLKEYLVNFCSGFIYTTALPPPVLGAIHAAVELIPSLSAERQRVLELSSYFRTQAKALGFNTGASTTHIIPVILGSENRALALSAWLEQHGILAYAIRPPSVRHGASLVRINLSAVHTQDQIDYLLEVLKNWNMPKER
jgi:8-amino-7-oxononanoate synthase